MIVASLVILVDQVLKAYAYDVSKELVCICWIDYYQLYCNGTFGGICFGERTLEIVLRRCWKRRWIRFNFVLVAFFRELLGSGKLFGFEVLGHKAKDIADSTGLYALGYENNGFMLLSPMALIRSWNHYMGPTFKK